MQMKILHILFSPEDAKLARKLPHNLTPVTVLSKNLKIPVAELNDKLTEMAHRGVVFDIECNGQRYVTLPPVVIGFFEYTFMRARGDAPMAELAQLFEKYMFEDDRFSRAVFQKQTQIGRSLVREESLPQGDHIEILDWERASRVVERATRTSSVR